MLPIFEYKDWGTPEPDWDNVAVVATRELAYGPLAICPLPECLREFYAPEARGPVVYSGAVGEPTGIAVPCGDHSEFAFMAGWMKRFTLAEQARRDERSPRTPVKCGECGEEYTTFLWGWGASRCPECTYQRIQQSPGEWTVTMIR